MSSVQRQFMTIDFLKKKQSTATFTYKHGEIDNNGVEATLVNVDTEGANGLVFLRDPDGLNLEPRVITIRGQFADFSISAEKVGKYQFELAIFNANGITKSGTFIYQVLPSLETSSTIALFGFQKQT